MATKSKPKSKTQDEQEPKPKPLHKFKLNDFKGGAVAGMLCIESFKDRSLLAPVQKWVNDGLLEFAAGDSDVLDGVLYLKGEKPTPAIEDDEPKRKPEPKREPSKSIKPAEFRGVAYMASEQIFVDGLVLPVGMRIVPFDKKQPHKFDSGEVNAAEDCASRLARESGSKPVTTAIGGCLRVIARAFLTDRKPEGSQ